MSIESRTVTATRYVTPLREGGSLPAIVEGDDDGMYVVKFRGAGQGPKVLVAELIAGEIGRALGLPVPEIVYLELAPELANAEPDEEIQDLLKASVGLNVALDFLPGSLAFMTATAPPIDPAFAALVVWFDAYTMNVDRTPSNPNIVLWHRSPWLIDHGAALYVHHTWQDAEARSRSAFPQIARHILLPFAGAIPEANAVAQARLNPEVIREIVALVPDVWIETGESVDRPVGSRQDYVDFLTRRLAAADAFVTEAERVRPARV
ncbi:MAG: aminotransferase class I and II [Thermomicrobiales bacterium]|nr:aminotransferase class I and II [Thermomicrobiales bacterium]